MITKASGIDDVPVVSVDRINYTQYTAQNITNSTHCDEVLHRRHRAADTVEQLLGRQQIGTVFSIDQELLLVGNKAVSNRVH